MLFVYASLSFTTLIFKKSEFYTWSNFDSLKGTVVGAGEICDSITIKENLAF